MRAFLIVFAIVLMNSPVSAEQNSCQDMHMAISQTGSCPKNGRACSCADQVSGVIYSFNAGEICDFPVLVEADLTLRESVRFNKDGNLKSSQRHIIGERWATNLDSSASIELSISNHWHGTFDALGQLVSFIRTGVSWKHVSPSDGVTYAGIGRFDVLTWETSGLWVGDNPYPYVNDEFCELLTAL